MKDRIWKELGSFKYLAVIINDNERMDQEVVHRVKKATSAHYQTCNIVVGRKEITRLKYRHTTN